MKTLILASGSPRRREIWQQVGLEFSVIPSRKEEVITKQDPKEAVMELALLKAEDIAGQTDSGCLVTGADTVVVKDGKILGKPKDEEDAARMLRMLSGGRHQVCTGVACILNGQKKVFCQETSVQFYPLSEDEIKEYIKTGEPMDKAGAYGIQGKAAGFIRGIEGDYYNVVGFPIARFLQELKNWDI
ncbi:Maf family protein [Anaerostipes sp.]|uniref:Maf family protein n=1 Tax=Anaerostipes sp. TaxID=1872530 RepID=UPI0025C2F1F9|nr:Maf family protein [Anaerostipes sp.]MBS7009727.1 septum formation inhibitor Maf [Anaerostipes sp.]